MTTELGCGDYQVFLQRRGGATRLIELPWSTLNFGRRLDEISDASVTISASGMADEECCWALSMLQAWEHEISIWRDDEEVWVGPIGEPTYTNDQVVIPARDLFAWFERRILPYDRTYTATDLGTIFQQYVNDALARDSSPNITVATTSVGIIGDRQVLASAYKRAADELRELARSGIDFTMIGRTMQVGGEEVPTGDIGALIDDNLIGPKLTVRGLVAASEVIVLGGQGQAAGNPVVGIAGGVGVVIGLVQQVVNEGSILDTNSAEFYAEGQLDLVQTPPMFIEAQLDPSTAILFGNLVPGSRADLFLDVGCKQVAGSFRLTDIGVAASAADAGQSETISVTFAPLGATDLGS